jgi:hypothetical protein
MHFLYFIYVRSGRPNYEKWQSQWSSSDAGVSLLVAGILVVSRNYFGSAVVFIFVFCLKKNHISNTYVSISFVQAHVSNPKAVILYIELHIFWVELFILFC